MQSIDSVVFEDVPLNVMLALDTSNSLQGPPLEELKQAAVAVVRLLRPGDRAALITFNDYVTLRAGWTAEIRQLETAIRQTEAAGNTALYDAAYSSLTLRHARPGRTLALLFSDGDDTASWLPGGHGHGDRTPQRGRRLRRGKARRVLEARLSSRLPFRGLQTGAPSVLRHALRERFLPALSPGDGRSGP